MRLPLHNLSTTYWIFGYELTTLEKICKDAVVIRDGLIRRYILPPDIQQQHAQNQRWQDSINVREYFQSQNLQKSANESSSAAFLILSHSFSATSKRS